jgi:hypothetical protein
MLLKVKNDIFALMRLNCYYICSLKVWPTLRSNVFLRIKIKPP